MFGPCFFPHLSHEKHDYATFFLVFCTQMKMGQEEIGLKRFLNMAFLIGFVFLFKMGALLCFTMMPIAFFFLQQ